METLEFLYLRPSPWQKKIGKNPHFRSLWCGTTFWASGHHISLILSMYVCNSCNYVLQYDAIWCYTAMCETVLDCTALQSTLPYRNAMQCTVPYVYVVYIYICVIYTSFMCFSSPTSWLSRLIMSKPWVFLPAATIQIQGVTEVAIRRRPRAMNGS